MSATVINLAARRHCGAAPASVEPVNQHKVRRVKQFAEARLRLHFWERLRDATSYAECLLRHHGADVQCDIRRLACEDLLFLDDSVLLEKIREAEAALLLTPVSNAEQLNQKRRLIKSSLFCIPVNATKLAAVLSADEAFLAMPSRNRRAAIGDA